MKTYIISFSGEVEVEAENEHEALMSGDIPAGATHWQVTDCFDEDGEEVEWWHD